jgi:hypothetical protein
MIDVLLALSLAAAEPWRCSGTLVPPAGYEQDVAFSAMGAGPAADAARRTLVERVCQQTACPELASRVAIWLTGEGNGQHCAMAVLERLLISEWRESQSSRSLHLTLREQLATHLTPSTTTAKALRPRVAVGSIGGGARVEPWLRSQLTQALSGLEGIDVVAAASKETTVVDLDVVERQEAQRAILDLGVRLTRADGTVKAFGATLPRAVIPVGVEEAGELGLEVTARCEQKTATGFAPVRDCAQTPLSAGDRLRLTVAPSSPAHVYVMAWNSKGQFQMLHPAPDEDNLVRGSLVLPHDDWLVLDEIGDVTEHLVVVAATKRQSHLELLRGVDLPPRTGTHDADALVATRGFLGEVRARGFKRPAAKASSSSSGAPAAVPVVERGPGVAAVEITIAHR